MFQKTILVALCIIQCFTTGLYIKLIKNGFSKKTLIVKTLCSGTFLALGIVSAIYSGGFDSLYAKLIVTALFCSLIGDIFLHGTPNTFSVILGGLGFLSAHILFIIAFVKAMGLPVFSIKNFIAIGIIFCVFAFIYYLLKLKAGKLFIPIVIYSLVLCFMLVKAINLGIFVFSERPVGSILLILGATLFVASDFTLGISFLGNRTYLKQALNVAFYFPAQTFIALTIYFLNF